MKVVEEEKKVQEGVLEEKREEEVRVEEVVIAVEMQNYREDDKVEQTVEISKEV